MSRDRVPVEVSVSASITSRIAATSWEICASGRRTHSRGALIHQTPQPVLRVSGASGLHGSYADPKFGGLGLVSLKQCCARRVVTPPGNGVPTAAPGGRPVSTSTTCRSQAHASSRTSTGSAIEQTDRLDRRQRRCVKHRESRAHQIRAQHHLLPAIRRAQPHRRAGQREHLILVTVERHPIAELQHRCTRHRIDQARHDAPSVCADNETDRSACNVDPQQVKQHRQHRDRIAHRLAPAMSGVECRNRPAERSDRPAARTAGADSPTTTARSPPQSDRRPDPLYPQPTSSHAARVRERVKSRGLMRSTGRQSITTAEPRAASEKVRCV